MYGGIYTYFKDTLEYSMALGPALEDAKNDLWGMERLYRLNPKRWEEIRDVATKNVLPRAVEDTTLAAELQAGRELLGCMMYGDMLAQHASNTNAQYSQRTPAFLDRVQLGMHTLYTQILGDADTAREAVEADMYAMRESVQTHLDTLRVVSKGEGR